MFVFVWLYQIIYITLYITAQSDPAMPNALVCVRAYWILCNRANHSQGSQGTGSSKTPIVNSNRHANISPRVVSAITCPCEMFLLWEEFIPRRDYRCRGPHLLGRLLNEAGGWRRSNSVLLNTGVTALHHEVALFDSKKGVSTFNFEATAFCGEVAKSPSCTPNMPRSVVSLEAWGSRIWYHGQGRLHYLFWVNRCYCGNHPTCHRGHILEYSERWRTLGILLASIGTEVIRGVVCTSFTRTGRWDKARIFFILNILCLYHIKTDRAPAISTNPKTLHAVANPVCGLLDR